jgi:hypothetical protein
VEEEEETWRFQKIDKGEKERGNILAYERDRRHSLQSRENIGHSQAIRME